MKRHTDPSGPVPRARFRGINLLTCAAMLAAQLTLLPNAARADITVSGAQVGADVVFSYSGSVDLTGFSPGPSGSSGGVIGPALDIFGADGARTSSYFSPSATSTPFGTGAYTFATSSTGGGLLMAPGVRQIIVPTGYVSGDPLSGTVTFAGKTFATLGVFGTGTYTTAFTPNFNFIVTFDPANAQISAFTTGLAMANAEGQMLIGAAGTVTNDVNGFLFNLRAGDGEEAANDGSISSAVDDGVVVGQGDGPDSPMARSVKRSRQWAVFTTANYGNVKLNAIGGQAGVQVDSWAPTVGVSRHLSRGLAVGFAASFLTSDQNYTGGLGRLHLEGPALTAYVSFVRKNFWTSLLYSFGDYELDSRRNPGFGFPQAFGSTRTYTNSVQYNTGWNFRFQNNTLVTGPFAGIDYLHGSVNGYNETGGGIAALSYAKQSFDSLVTRVGWTASKKIQTDWALITPQVRLSYERQNLKNNGTSVNLINAPFSAAGGNQTPGQDYMVAGAGVNFQFSDQFSMLLNYQGQFFRQDMQAHYAQVRFGYKF